MVGMRDDVLLSSKIAKYFEVINSGVWLGGYVASESAGSRAAGNKGLGRANVSIQRTIVTYCNTI